MTYEQNRICRNCWKAYGEHKGIEHKVCDDGDIFFQPSDLLIFSLRDALNGAAVVTRKRIMIDGVKKETFFINDAKETSEGICFFVEGIKIYSHKNGNHLKTGEPSQYDLFMHSPLTPEQGEATVIAKTPFGDVVGIKHPLFEQGERRVVEHTACQGGHFALTKGCSHPDCQRNFPDKQVGDLIEPECTCTETDMQNCAVHGRIATMLLETTPLPPKGQREPTCKYCGIEFDPLRDDSHNRKGRLFDHDFEPEITPTQPSQEGFEEWWNAQGGHGVWTSCHSSALAAWNAANETRSRAFNIVNKCNIQLGEDYKVVSAALTAAREENKQTAADLLFYKTHSSNGDAIILELTKQRDITREENERLMRFRDSLRADCAKLHEENEANKAEISLLKAERNERVSERDLAQGKLQAITDYLRDSQTFPYENNTAKLIAQRLTTIMKGTKQ